MRFLEQIGAPPRERGGRRWVYVPYDQLTDAAGPLSELPPGELGVVLVESPWKAARRPYHRQKLALVLTSLRHFAIEQARRGVAVRHVVHDGPYREALAPVVAELGPLEVMEPAEWELRVDLAPLVESGDLVLRRHEGWLTTREEFLAACGAEPPWKLERFYRHLRKGRGILMEGGGYAGGRLSHDAANRRSWKGEPPAPEPPRFEVDEITAEVAELIRNRFDHHPGTLDPAALPATREDVERLWRWAREACLPCFGPFEDAMTRASRGLFHTRISPVMNLHRLMPARVLADVLAMEELPLASREGFLRQVLGWREFVRHVHRETDGFRVGIEDAEAPAAAPGDGGWSRWSGRPWRGSAGPEGLDGGARPANLGPGGPLPPAFWGVPSGMACLDEVVGDVWSEGWSHHITRLMVLSNIATLLDASPRELADWFWVAYVDAFDWVVEPNVLGMGTFSTGSVMSTKPYVSGAAYLKRMSDYCPSCSLDPRSTCPLTPMYWAFLARQRQQLETNPRMKLPLAAEAKRDPGTRQRDAAIFEEVRARLAAGERVPGA